MDAVSLSSGLAPRNSLDFWNGPGVVAWFANERRTADWANCGEGKGGEPLA